MGKTEKRLYGPALLTAAAADTYTVPASTTAKIRHIHFFNEDTASRTVTASIGVDAVGTRIFQDFIIAAKSPYDYYPDLNLVAAEKIQAYSDVTLKVTMVINGYESVL